VFCIAVIQYQSLPFLILEIVTGYPMTVLTYRGKQYDTVEHQKEVHEWQKLTREAGHRCVYRGVEIDPRYAHESLVID